VKEREVINISQYCGGNNAREKAKDNFAINADTKQYCAGRVSEKEKCVPIHRK